MHFQCESWYQIDAKQSQLLERNVKGPDHSLQRWGSEREITEQWGPLETKIQHNITATFRFDKMWLQKNLCLRTTISLTTRTQRLLNLLWIRTALIWWVTDWIWNNLESKARTQIRKKKGQFRDKLLNRWQHGCVQWGHTFEGLSKSSCA